MMTLRAAIFGGMAFFAGATSVFAACEDLPTGLDAVVPNHSDSYTEVGQDFDTILERGFIRFAAYEDFPPFSYEENGKPAGIDIEIGKMIAEEIGVEARFTLITPAEDVAGDLRNYVWKGPITGGEVANVMLHIPYDRDLECRNPMAVLTGPYYNENVSIAYRKDVYPDGGPVPAYFRFDKVGVENDSIADFYLTMLLGAGAAANIHRYPTPMEAMAALDAGDVSAVMAPQSQLEAGLTDAIAVHSPPLVNFSKSKWTIGLAVRSSYRELGYVVGDAIQAGLDNGKISEIFEKFGVSFHKPEW